MGHTAKLTIREELPNGTEISTVAEQQLAGPLMIFNLDKDKSKIFVGGVSSKYEMQNDVRDFNAFQGEAEEVSIGNTPLSLWNFVDGYNNYNGSVERWVNIRHVKSHTMFIFWFVCVETNCWR